MSATKLSPFHSTQDLDSPQAAPLRLLQLTDPHLFAEPAGRLLGITTRSSFEAVLALALEGHKQAHALILTGDLVHDESPAGYRYLRQTLEGTGLPYFCIAGNHDRRDLMNEHLGNAALEPFSIRPFYSWNLIFLDSLDPGRNSGRLPLEQLAQLSDLLLVRKEPSVVFLHHHPTPIKSAWMDTMGAENGADLIRICERNTQVKAVVFGHIHQEFSSSQAGCQILGTPSTCIQFLPDSKDFALDDLPPGYRELTLYPDGRLTTHVVRLEGLLETPTPHAEGY